MHPRLDPGTEYRARSSSFLPSIKSSCAYRRPSPWPPKPSRGSLSACNVSRTISLVRDMPVQSQFRLIDIIFGWQGCLVFWKMRSILFSGRGMAMQTGGCRTGHWLLIGGQLQQSPQRVSQSLTSASSYRPKHASSKDSKFDRRSPAATNAWARRHQARLFLQTLLLYQ